jgi:hypothetical protein
MPMPRAGEVAEVAEVAAAPEAGAEAALTGVGPALTGVAVRDKPRR